MRRLISSIMAATTFVSLSANYFPVIAKTTAAAYRTSYKVYGDLNNDNVIDSFDVIALRKAVVKGDYSKDLDFNCDEVVDSLDISLLNGYVLGENTFFDAYRIEDADKDNLCDILEITVLNTNPDSADTDGDMLSDFEEVVYSNTSPTNKNTRGLAVTDADDDTDGDKLTNKEEIAANTNPQSDDTDMDGINDYDELKKYSTDPLNEDSDDDGILDGDEIKIGLNPSSSNSDGVTPDNKRIVEQIISADSPLLSEINTNDNAYNLSLVINASGCADSCLSIKPSGFAYVMKDGSAVGEVPAFSYNDEFTVQSITLKFEIKEEFRDNVSHYFDAIDGEYYDYTYTIPAELDGIKRFNIFKYFEDVNLSMPIETQYDTKNNIVYSTISNFETDENGKSYGIGSYSLVDLEVWTKIMNNGEEISTHSPQNAPMSITLDSNYSILADETTYISKAIKTFSDSLDESIASITKNYESFKASNSNKNGQKDFIEMFGHKYACFEESKISWEEAEARCEKMGGHLITVNTPMELSLLNESLSSGRNGGFYWLGASGGSSNWSWITGESTSYAKTVTVGGYSMDNCRNYFSYFGNKLAYVPRLGYLSEGTPSISKIKGYICEWENGANVKNANGTGVTVFISGRKITLNGMIKNLSGNDTDNDGVSDYDEVDFNAIKKIGGSSAQSITWEQGYDYLKDKGYVSDKSYSKIADLVKDMAKNQEVYPTKSNPSDIDTDGDGILDQHDPTPNKAHDARFILVDSFNHIPKLGTPDTPWKPEYVKAHEKELYQKLYEERFPEIYNDPLLTKIEVEKINIKFWGTRTLGNIGNGLILAADSIINNSAILKELDALPGVKIINNRNINEAGYFLYYYHTGYGGTVVFDATEIVEKTISGKENFRSNLSYLRKACEETTIEGDTNIISTTDTATFSAWKNDANILSNKALDTFLALNECDANMVAKCTYDGKKYHASVNYFIQDYYDFYEYDANNGKNIIGLVTNDEYVLLALFDKAKPFDVLGTYTFDISWEKGSYEYQIEK